MKDFKKAFAVCLYTKNPFIIEISAKEIKLDMEHYNASTPEEMSDENIRVFSDATKAAEFLELYLKTLKNLDNKKLCKNKNAPNLLFKRRYIVLALLGLKLSTVRKGQRKSLKIGQLVNLYDQTYFYTVRLINEENLGKGQWKYTYEQV